MLAWSNSKNWTAYLPELVVGDAARRDTGLGLEIPSHLLALHASIIGRQFSGMLVGTVASQAIGPSLQDMLFLKLMLSAVSQQVRQRQPEVLSCPMVVEPDAAESVQVNGRDGLYVHETPLEPPSKPCPAPKD